MLNAIMQLIPGSVGAWLNPADDLYYVDTGEGYRVLSESEILLIENKIQWAAQAQSRKEREARKVLALPDSDDPKILKQKLNAALALLMR